VLTHRWQSASRALIDDTATHPHRDASSLRKRCACDCQHYKKPLCCSHFCNSQTHHATRIRRHRDSSTPEKARRTDSESRFLAMKKFSCLPASRLIVARQNRIFARIAVADSLAAISGIARCIAAYGEQLMHASVLRNGPTAVTKTSRRDDDSVASEDDGVASGAVQMPSLALSRSLTACGFALPPDDFIT
jgi:hypothetical protein